MKNRTLINLLICTIAAICTSCGSKEYHINGIFTVPDSTRVYLIDLEANDTLSTTVVAGGRFSFEGELDEPLYAYVGYAKKRVRFILEPGTVTTDIDERVVYGTPAVEAYNRYHNRYYGFNALRNRERKELKGIRDSISAKEFGDRWEEINARYLAMQADLADSVAGCNQDNLFGALVMEDLAVTDPERFMKRYNEVSEKVRNFGAVGQWYKNIGILENTAPGKMFLDYTVKGGNPDGSNVKLSDYVGRGRYILLDHWASWCGPCKAEMKYLRQVHQLYKDANLTVVGIAVSDKREDTVAELQKLQLPWPQILDAQSIPKDVYGVRSIPHLILFAPDGTILYRGLSGEQILSVLQQLPGIRK